MIIEVNSLTDTNNSHIYKDILDVGESIDESFFIVYKLNHETHRFPYNKYNWKELTPDEAMARGVYANENENLKYKLAVNDSGYGMNCNKCERIIFIQPKVGDSVELDPKKLSELDWININGIKFKREK